MRPTLLALSLLGLAPVACGSSPAGPADSGVTTSPPDTGSHQGPDASDATMTGRPDVISIFGDTGTFTQPDATGTDSGGVDGAPGDATSAKDGGHDAGGKPDTGSGKDAGKDAGAKDTGTAACTTVTVVTGTGGAQACPSPVSGTCGPGSIASFTPHAPPPATRQNVCTAAMVQAVYDGCLGPSSSDTACTNADPNGFCYNCIFTDETAASWGPTVSGADMVANINVGGCLQLLEPCNAACAATYENDLQCEQAACSANCPITGTAESETAYSNCANTIDGCDPHGCFEYSNGESCSAEITGAGHPGSVCFENEDNFEAAFLAIVPLFCSTN